jgi:hypothetical protein
MKDIKKYLIDFKAYVENPSIPLSPQEKKEFDEDLLEISKRIGGGGFLGLFKRKITPESIVSYKATALVFEMIGDYLLSKGFDLEDNPPTEVYPLSHDDFLFATLAKGNLYVTIYCRGIWFSPHYQLNVLFYKDFDFDIYREDVALNLKENYDLLVSEDPYSDISFDFDPKDLYEPLEVFNDFQKTLNAYSKLNISKIRNYI